MRLRAGWVGWSFALYPDAGEGGGCLVVPRRVEPSGGRPDPERAAAEAGRRARGKIRRYRAANRLNRLGTLTYRGSGCHEPERLRVEVAEFFRGLREGIEAEGLPYLWVPQWHPGGHGLHVHFAVGRFVPRRLIEQAWGHGFVHIKLLSELPAGTATVAEARLAARYLARYVGRDSDDERRRPGLHRYEVAQGFHLNTRTSRRFRDPRGDARPVAETKQPYAMSSLHRDRPDTSPVRLPGLSRRRSRPIVLLHGSGRTTERLTALTTSARRSLKALGGRVSTRSLP